VTAEQVEFEVSKVSLSPGDILIVKHPPCGQESQNRMAFELGEVASKFDAMVLLLPEEFGVEVKPCDKVITEMESLLKYLKEHRDQ
jgi:hypothetical protein